MSAIGPSKDLKKIWTGLLVVLSPKASANLSCLLIPSSMIIGKISSSTILTCCISFITNHPPNPIPEIKKISAKKEKKERNLSLLNTEGFSINIFDLFSNELVNNIFLAAFLVFFLSLDSDDGIE